MALSVNTIESIEAFIFYLVQYSISNLNVFIVIIAIGYSFYFYISNNKEHWDLLDKNNSPVQLINQLRGYFYINPGLSLSLVITIFSFIGVPPLIGFFAKQLVLSAALDNGYFFMALLAIITSVVGGVYYLNIIKEVFFISSDHKINPILLENINIGVRVFDRSNDLIKSLTFNFKNIVISSTITVTISIVTLIVLLFIIINKEWLDMGGKKHLLSFGKVSSNTNNIAVKFYRSASSTCVTSNFSSRISSRIYASRLQILRYSSLVSQTSISPWFISGFTDAEGCFNISIQKNPNGKYYVRPLFKIKLHLRDKPLLVRIQDYFGGIGKIHITSKSCDYMVRSKDDIIKIISHFDKYPLITQKKADYELFKRIVDKIIKGEHVTPKGLQEIINIRASINLGLIDKTNFPNTIPVARPLVENNQIPDPLWVAGFVSGEGNFLVMINRDVVSLRFSISQHNRDDKLLKSLISYFECGLFNSHSGENKSGVFIVRKFSDISDKIITFFQKYEIEGIKREDFNDWCKVHQIMKSKAHLKKEGVEIIRQIKSGMNTLR